MKIPLLVKRDKRMVIYAINFSEGSGEMKANKLELLF